MGAIGLVESVERNRASSSLTKCSSVYCTTINILRSLLKAALACLVLCWRAKNILVSADRVVLLVPKGLLYLCFSSTAWATLTGEGLSAVTFLVLGGCESKLSSWTVVWLPTLPDLLLPVPPGYCDTGVWLALTVKAWGEETGVLGGHRGCVNP